MTYTPDQVDAVARRIYHVTSDRLVADDCLFGKIPSGTSYPLHDWPRAVKKVKRFYREWARRALGVA